MRVMIVTLFAASLLFSNLASAQEAGGMGGQGIGRGGKKMMMARGGMMGRKGMRGGSGGKMEKSIMHGVIKSMMAESIIETNDGNIVVMTGDRVIKYDKDLNLLKEVKIEMDFERMKNMLKELRAMCPMRKGMMGDEKEDSSLEMPKWLSD